MTLLVHGLIQKSTFGAQIKKLKVQNFYHFTIFNFEVKI